tara:strand:+ start:610 stop:1422 length:813 start_codon:yes stop_codon:yes gene_type:complete
MKKNSKNSIIDKYGLCLNEYKNNINNAKVYFDRAIGKSPEMEVSKAMTNIIKPFIKENDTILDVGCASGHFYRSIKKRVKKNFFYTGVDPYEIFLKKAREAWKNDNNVSFLKGNIYKLPFKTNKFDISFCSNVFLHLNEIKQPLKEIIRVTRKKIIIRTVLYDVSYKIQLVYNKNWWSDTNVKATEEFDKNGNPKAFSFFNIHSFDYFIGNIKKINSKCKIKIIKDKYFNKKIITDSNKKEKRPLATKIIGNEQVSGCILQPHYFVIITK